MTDFADEASRVEQLQRDDALARLGAGVQLPANATGDCDACGERIEPARLSAIPHARRCIDCQRIHEGKRV